MDGSKDVNKEALKDKGVINCFGMLMNYSISPSENLSFCPVGVFCRCFLMFLAHK